MPIPTSTYRLQIQRDFTLDDAAGVLDYLRELGVGAVYLSPLLQATTGSPHGYDTTDVTRVDADRGGAEGLRALLAAARDAGLGVVIDIVPNHLGISVPAENPAWWDVLSSAGSRRTRGGSTSTGAGTGSSCRCWATTRRLSVQDGELRYFEHRFPLAPGTVDAG